MGDRKISPAGVAQVFAWSPPPPSPPPLSPSLPFIPGTIVQASFFGPLHIPGPKQKPFLTPMTRPAVILSGMCRPPGLGWGACMLPIYILACQLQGEQGPVEGGGLKEWGVQNHQISRQEGGSEGRTTSSGVPGQGSEAGPEAGEDSNLGRPGSLALHTPRGPRPSLVSHIVCTLDFTLYSIWLLLFFNEVRLKIHLPGPACLGLKAIKLETNLLIRVSLCKSHLINSLSSLALSTARPGEGIGLPVGPLDEFPWRGRPFLQRWGGGAASQNLPQEGLGERPLSGLINQKM